MTCTANLIQGCPEQGSPKFLSNVPQKPFRNGSRAGDITWCDWFETGYILPTEANFS